MADFMDSDGSHHYGSPEREVGTMPEEMPSDLIRFLEHWMRSHVALNGQGSFVAIEDILNSADVLRRWGNTVTTIAEEVKRKGLESRVCCDEHGYSLRLRDETEQLRLVVEDTLWNQLIPGDMSLIDVMNQPLVSHWLTAFGAQLARERIERLKQAVNSSEQLVIIGSRIAPKNFAPDAQYWDAGPMWVAGSMMFGHGFDENSPDQMPQMPGFEFQWPSMDPGTPMMVMPVDPPESYYTMDQGYPDWCYSRDQRYKRGRSRRKSSKELVTETAAEVLDMYTSDLAEDGSMSIATMLQHSEWLSTRFRTDGDLIKALMHGGETSPLMVDPHNRTVRFRTFHERLVALCEMLLASRQNESTVLTLAMAVESRAMQSLFAKQGTSSAGELSRAEILRQALEYAEILQVMPSIEGGSSDFVDWRSPAEILLGPVEKALTQSLQEVIVMEKEGEVPLSMLAQEPFIGKVLERAGIKSSQAILAGLQSALRISKDFELDSASLSCRPKKQNRGKLDSFQPKLDDAEQVSWSRPHIDHFLFVPNEKDAMALRKLLQHYFQPFNLQYNRVFVSLLQASSRRLRKYSVAGSDNKPYFTIEDICLMPRIREVFIKYTKEGCNCLLAAAFGIEEDEEMPVNLCRPQASSAKGMNAQRMLWLELSYAPIFRYFEESQRCQEVQVLLDPTIEKEHKMEAMSPNSFLVMSYSISSDLSSVASPKAEELFEATARGDLDPTALFWENRLPKIKRQLLWHVADIICVQGIQSVGKSSRCSESDVRWFSCDNDPIVNHLAFLYRELAPKNYGVVFMPTMSQPESDYIHFGNAVFWKRNRWQMERYWSSGNCAVCVEFTSRLHGPDLLVCCSRAGNVYSAEWGQCFSNEELISELLPVQEQLLRFAEERDLRPVWCGDFGTDSDAVMTELAKKRNLIGGEDEDVSAQKWFSSSKSVLGHDPWTSSARFTAGQATDLILHNEGLKPIAVLSGLPMECHGKSTSLELLQSGYPSDHLIQMAAFMDSSQRGSPLLNSAEAERPPLRERNSSDRKASQSSRKMQRVHRKGWRSWEDLQ